MSRVTVFVLVGLFVAVGCSPGLDDAARPVEDAPPELLNPTTTEAPPEPEEDVQNELMLMFVDPEGRRVAVARRWETRPTVQDVLDGIGAQPLEEEIAEHAESPISTRLFPSLEPQDRGLDAGILRVFVQSNELREAAEATPDRARLIYGQIVCSIAALENPPSDAVLISDEEGAISPVADGAVVLDGPARPSDYSDCQTAADIAAEEAENVSTTTTEEGG